MGNTFDSNDDATLSLEDYITWAAETEELRDHISLLKEQLESARLELSEAKNVIDDLVRDRT